METANIFSKISSSLKNELFEDIVKTAAFKIERIVSQGHCSPPDFWYDQETHEWVILLQGSAGLLFEGEEQPITLQPGDYCNIPAHHKHRVAWTDPKQKTVWLAVHY